MPLLSTTLTSGHFFMHSFIYKEFNTVSSFKCLILILLNRCYYFFQEIARIRFKFSSCINTNFHQENFDEHKSI